MKKILFFLFITCIAISCSNKSGGPDIAGIKIDIKVDRFDRDFFNIDTNNIATGLRNLKGRYPEFYPIFMQEVLLGPGTADTSALALNITKEFLRGYAGVYDTLKAVYSNTDKLEKDLEESFRYVKYYFPQYKTNRVILFLGPFDAPGIAATDAGLAIGIQQYAGSNYSVYRSGPGQEMFPIYISRRFSPEYIATNCMKAVSQDLFPDNSGGKTLVDQMIERGKQWYLSKLFLPTTHDTLITGYTKEQLKWCEENEGLIWSYIIKTEDLHSLSPAVIQTYIGEGPFTQGLSQELSPGNIGQWLGWRIVEKYAAKYPGMHPREIMITDPGIILDKAKYKPK